MSDFDGEYKITEHPMEDIFDIEKGSTNMPVVSDREVKELVVHNDYDDKDQEIEEQFQEIYEAAMEAFETQTADSEVIEPKFRARNQEVAVQFLNAALNAAKEKSSLKVHKDKLNAAKMKATGPQTVNNNLVVADRNELLKTLLGKNSEDEE